MPKNWVIEPKPPSSKTLPIAPAAPPAEYAATGFAIAVIGEAGKNLSMIVPTIAAAPTPTATLPRVQRLNTLLIPRVTLLVLEVRLRLAIVDFLRLG